MHASLITLVLLFGRLLSSLQLLAFGFFLLFFLGADECPVEAEYFAIIRCQLSWQGILSGHCVALLLLLLLTHATTSTVLYRHELVHLAVSFGHACLLFLFEHDVI